MVEEPEWGTEADIPRRPYWQIAVNTVLVLATFTFLIFAIMDMPDNPNEVRDWLSNYEPEW